MKSRQAPEIDEMLSRTLSEWKVDEPLPPRFQEQVWRRIERTERAQATEATAPSMWTGLARWIDTVLPRPALATAYVAVLLAIGVTAGWAQARDETSRIHDELGQRYVRVLDPYQAPLR